MDDFDQYVQEQLNDPEYAKAYRKVLQRQGRFQTRLCSEGVCHEIFDPETGEVDSSVGPADCLCQEK